jgi:hypothetical protein
MAAGFLAKHGCLVIESDPAASRVKLARLTVRGLRAQAGYRRRVAGVEAQWREQFGAAAIERLHKVLTSLLSATDGRASQTGCGPTRTAGARSGRTWPRPRP